MSTSTQSTAARHRSLLTASGHRVVVGIDFGASHSGFAYAHVSDPGRIECLYEWEDQPVPYCKNYSALWYNIDEKKSEGWGYTAVRKEMDHIRDGPSAYRLLTLLKFFIEPTAAEHATVTLPHGVDALEVVADYLSQLYKVLLERLQRNFGESLQGEDLHFCLTVPAIWSEQAKQTMRQVAVKAGLISPAEINMPRLTLVLEPEAAAIFCCKRFSEAQLRSGDTFMVVDAGGGTVDIVAEKWTSGINNQRLTELARGDGDWCGSTFVDSRFLEWLGNKVGQTALSQLKEEKGRDFMQVLTSWESTKRQFKGEESFRDKQYIPFSIPGSLYNLMSDESMQKLQNEQDGVDDDVYITLDDMKSFFDPIVDKTLDLIQTQLDRCPGNRCNKLFVVGGFSASPYLTRRIQERFSGSFDNLVFPREPGAAVVQGAVLHGLNPDSIQGRCSRFTYGLLLSRPESGFMIGKTQRSNQRDIFLHTEENRQYVEYFQPAIVANQVVQTSVTVSVYATAAAYKSETSFSDVAGRFDVGFLAVDDVPLTGDRSITVHFYFGLTELTVIARVNGTGVEKRIAVNFATR
ncbi:hypothetical protein PhCBS80983_g05543 [Powellomyces hirtus]|uniref:Uncharacterized protein n=1 Tax=Powellomyces hirtus TaxID=109895 RepID=A0A507DWC5_9FUNG|nr:hypothetical protein PhCBS80983_g05543 [Powellomyces hirtus]